MLVIYTRPVNILAEFVAGIRGDLVPFFVLSWGD